MLWCPGETGRSCAFATRNAGGGASPRRLRNPPASPRPHTPRPPRGPLPAAWASHCAWWRRWGWRAASAAAPQPPCDLSQRIGREAPRRLRYLFAVIITEAPGPMSICATAKLTSCNVTEPWRRSTARRLNAQPPSHQRPSLQPPQPPQSCRPRPCHPRPCHGALAPPSHLLAPRNVAA